MKLPLILTFIISTSAWPANLTVTEWMKSNCPTCSLLPGDDLRIPYASGTLQMRVNQIERKRIRLTFLRGPDQNGTFRIFHNADKNPEGRNADAKLLCEGMGAGWKPSEVRYNIVYKTSIPNTPPTPDYETISILECKKGFNISLSPLPGPTFTVPLNVNNKDRESGKEGVFIQENVTIPITIKPQMTSPQ